MHKSGKPKGNAYVEYEDEADAGRAVANADGTVVLGFYLFLSFHSLGEVLVVLLDVTLGRRMHVAISNPPQRASDGAFTKKKEEDSGRKGHGSKLQMIPRSLTKNVAPTSATCSSSVENEASKGSQKPLSNAEFREKFLKR